MEVLNDAFGYAVLAWVPGAWIANVVLSGPVMAARAKYGVKYPNLYAVPGQHKNADEFNAVQRGHQNFLETVHAVQLMALFGSLHSEKAALANVAGAVCFYTGAYLYGKGYAKHWDKENGRYKTGGAIKYIGILTALVTSVMTGLKMSSLLS